MTADVSRVVYDATLKRVQEARTWHDLNDLGCERLTLAALGLDEPPTETPKACPYCDGEGTIENVNDYTDPATCRRCDGSGVDGGTR